MNVVGVFEQEEDLVAAASAAREAGLGIQDAYSPYPVPGMDELLEIRHSRLGWVAFAGGMGMAALVLFFQIWVEAVDWPLNSGGKPNNSLPAFVPATFELGVLCAALSTVAALLLRSRLFPGRQTEAPAPGLNDDRFALVLRAGDRAEEARSLLRKFNARIPGTEGGEAR